MATMRPHRRQFIITRSERPEGLSQLDHFETLPLGPNTFLHHDKDIEVQKEKDRLILGRMLREGDGRYVTIGDGWLSLDATGSLGIHCLAEGDVVCTSSPTLMKIFTGRGIRVPDPHVRFSWIPAPMGPVEGSFRLFCDQSLELATGEIRVDLLNRSETRTLRAASELFAQESIDIVRALSETGRPLYVALTGGQDSRTIFAALKAAGVRFKAFTMQLSDGASHKDIRVAKAISDQFCVEHSVFSASRIGAKERVATYLSHSSGIDGDRGRQYAGGDYYRTLPEDALVIHGGTLGLSKIPFDHLLAEFEAPSKESILRVFDLCFGPLASDDLSALGEWFEYRLCNPIGTIGDHFFLDQRRATWGADNRFAEDVFGFEWFLFANSWKLVDCFWSVDRVHRDGLELQKQAIELMLPGFSEKVPPVNPEMNWRERMRGRFSRRGLQKILQRINRFKKGS